MSFIYYVCIPGLIIMLILLIVILKKVQNNVDRSTHEEHMYSEKWDSIFKGNNW